MIHWRSLWGDLGGRKLCSSTHPTAWRKGRSSCSLAQRQCLHEKMKKLFLLSMFFGPCHWFDILYLSQMLVVQLLLLFACAGQFFIVDFEVNDHIAKDLYCHHPNSICRMQSSSMHLCGSIVDWLPAGCCFYLINFKDRSNCWEPDIKYCHIIALYKI